MSLFFDSFYSILPFLDNKDKASVSNTCKDIHNISKIFLDPSSDDNRAIIDACRDSNISLIDHLLQDARVDINARDGMSLYDACKRGDSKVIERLLIDERIDVNVREGSAISYIIQHNMQDFMVDILNRETSGIGITHLESSIYHGRIGIASLLIEDARCFNDRRTSNDRLRWIISLLRHGGNQDLVNLINLN